VLIVAPGSLVEQWQDEMFEKFGLEFTLFSRELVEQSRRAATRSTTST
jgi:SNF2 family DNA or RNA helicase